MQRRTRQKKRIPLHASTPRTQRLEVPHLANRRAPMHQQPLVQTPAVCEFGGPRLKRNGVAYDGGEVAVVEPADGFFAGLQADGDGVVAGAGFAFGFGGVAVGGKREGGMD